LAKKHFFNGLIGYQNCPKCPDSLPAAVEKKVPGGKFSGDFPDVKKAFKY